MNRETRNKFIVQFHFKPEFGNQEHLRILEEMGKYVEIREKYEEVLMGRSQDLDLQKKCIKLKKRVKNMIVFAERNRVEK